MKNIKLTALLIMGAIIAVSCKKNSDAPSGSGSAINVSNISGTYKLTAATITIDGETTDVLGTLDECERDNLQKLNSDLTYKVIDAGVQCNPPNNETGTWSLEGTSTIVLDGIPVDIDKFDGTNLTISVSGENEGVPYKVKQVLTKQ